MFAIGGLLIWLAIAKEYEPTLLLPIGLGAILANIPHSAAIGVDGEPGILTTLFDVGIRTEMFPLLIFVAIGAMIDFGPLLQNPKMLLFGAAAQFGIFFTMCLAAAVHFTLKESASIGIIGAADGPTSIVVANRFAPHLLGPITVAAYSYMSLVPIIQPPVIRLLTTQAERRIRMDNLHFRPGLAAHADHLSDRRVAGGRAVGAERRVADRHVDVRQFAARVGRRRPALEGRPKRAGQHRHAAVGNLDRGGHDGGRVPRSAAR